jgi:hypothetical protein
MIKEIDPYKFSRGANMYTFISRMQPYVGYIFNVYRKSDGKKIVDRKVFKRVHIEDFMFLNFEFYKTFLIVRYSEKLNNYLFEVIEPEIHPNRSDYEKELDLSDEEDFWEFDVDKDSWRL